MKQEARPWEYSDYLMGKEGQWYSKLDDQEAKDFLLLTVNGPEERLQCTIVS